MLIYWANATNGVHCRGRCRTTSAQIQLSKTFPFWSSLCNIRKKSKRIHENIQPLPYKSKYHCVLKHGICHQQTSLACGGKFQSFGKISDWTQTFVCQNCAFWWKIGLFCVENLLLLIFRLEKRANMYNCVFLFLKIFNVDPF